MLTCKLLEIMAQKNINLKELSKISGIKIQTLEKYYYNKIKKINFKTLNKLCKALKCTISSLFDYKN